MAAPVFTGGAYCSFAKTLRLRWDADEASIRTSVSRAYYGAFLEARDAKGLSSYGASGHSDVIGEYARTGHPADRTISASLRTLKRLREKADYELRTSCTKTDAHDAIREAEKVLRALSISPPKLPDLVPLLAPSKPPAT